MSGLSSIIHSSAKSDRSSFCGSSFDSASLELNAWPLLRVALMVIHLLAAAGIVFSALPFVVQSILLLFLPLCFYYYAQRLPAASRVAVSALQWHSSQWQLRLGGHWVKADIVDVVIWANWVFLRFRVAGKLWPVDLVLCRQHFTSQAAWCSLRRQLQMVEL